MKYYFADTDKRKIKKELKIVIIKSEKTRKDEEISKEENSKKIDTNINKVNFINNINKESFSSNDKTDNLDSKKLNLEKTSKKDLNELMNKSEEKNEFLFKRDEIMEKKPTNKINKIQLLSNLTNDSYSDYALDNTFAVFKSVNDIFYLIYSNISKSIIGHHIIENKKIIEIKNAHKKDITNFRHFFDKVNKRDLIISISLSDNNLKLWNITNFECLINLENINKSGRLFSACLFQENSTNYIVTGCAYGNNESIKIFDMNSNKIKELNDSTDSVYFMDIYYDQEASINYIIVGSNGLIKSYDYSNDKIYHKYNDNSKNRHCSIIIKNNDSDKIIKLIDSCFDGNIRMWDFHSGKLLNKIGLYDNIWSIGMCLCGDDYLFVGCGDKSIKVIHLKKGLIEANLNGFKNKVLCVKKIIHPQFGECIISQGYEKEQIKLFVINNVNE